MKKIIFAALMCIITVLAGGITLEESIELARRNNKELLMAREEVLKAEQTYYDVRGYLLPQVMLQGGYTLKKTWLPDGLMPPRVDFSSELDAPTENEEYLAGALDAVVNSMIPSSPRNEGSLAMQVQLQQVLFLGGKLINGIRAVDRYRSIQRLMEQLVEQNVVLGTTELFYQCLLAQKLQQVQSDGLATANRHLQRVEAFYREGQVSEFDLLRARLEVAKLKPQVFQAENTYKLALTAFRRQIGAADENIIPDAEFVLPPAMIITLEDAIREGIDNRIELELADINTQIMQIRWNAEKGNYLPNVALQADYSIYTAADEFGIERKDFGSRYTIGIGIQIPLFTGFSNTSKRKYAKHGYLKARLQQQDSEELIAMQIKQNYQSWQHALENYEVQSENIRLAERSLQLAQVRFDNQMGIQLEVFDAQIMLSALKLQYYQSIFEVISAERNLQKSIGIRL
ncbi:MAG: TolC family protein [Candidatus Cloacimonadaceae bacterium]|nr:TolC family protein [Candidatus Cloacimonadaceae bacterium]MDP3114899.1 TolC family protein [Candidatus Cloacimonadaceae bacterium]